MKAVILKRESCQVSSYNISLKDKKKKKKKKPWLSDELFHFACKWAWPGRSKFISCLWRMKPRQCKVSFHLNCVLLSQQTRQESVCQLNKCLLRPCYMRRSNTKQKVQEKDIVFLISYDNLCSYLMTAICRVLAIMRY